MKKPQHYLILLLMIACTPAPERETTNPLNDGLLTEPEEGFEFLFNGENLDGWHVVTETGPPDGLFAVEDGILHAYPTQEANSMQTFGGVVTDNDFGNYVIKLEYMWGENKFKPRDNDVRDAGLLFHVHNEEIFWPDAVECQIQEGDTGDIWIIGTRVSSKVDRITHGYSPNGDTVAQGDPEDRYHRSPRGYSWEVPGWNVVEVEVRGAHAKYTVNGHVVNEAFDMKYWNDEEDGWSPLTSGKILLQAEGAEVYYRNVQIKQL